MVDSPATDFPVSHFISSSKVEASSWATTMVSCVGCDVNCDTFGFLSQEGEEGNKNNYF